MSGNESDNNDIERDFYSEGYDAALAGNSDITPEDVQAAGLVAEASWNDGYNHAFLEEQEDDEDEEDNETEDDTEEED